MGRRRNVAAQPRGGFRSGCYVHIPVPLHRDADGRTMVRVSSKGRTSDDFATHRRAWLASSASASPKQDRLMV